MKYAQFSADGTPLAFYDEGINPSIPGDAISISDEQWRYLLNNPGKSRWDGSGVVQHRPLASIKTEKLAALDAERNRLEALPITGNQGGKLFTISRPEKINEFLMGGLSIALDPSPAASFTMLDDNGVEVTYSKTLMGQIIAFINSSKQPALARYNARKAAIEAAADATELAAVDTDLTKP